MEVDSSLPAFELNKKITMGGVVLINSLAQM